MTGPEKARLIAVQTAAALADMRAETDRRSLDRKFGTWMDWSKSMGVCHQIREHVGTAYAECKRDIAPVPTPDRKTQAAGGE